MITAKPGETITLFVDTYDATPTAEERARAGVDDNFVLHSEHPKLLGKAPIVAACYGDDREENWFRNPNGSGELVVTVQPGRKTLAFTMVIGSSPYTIGRIKRRLPDGTVVILGQAGADYPRGWVTIEGT